MVKAWFMDNTNVSVDPRLPHVASNASEVTQQQLDALGVRAYFIPPGPAADGYHTPALHELRKAQGYTRYDVITISPDKFPNYEEKMKVFFDEHLHVDDEIRYVAEGSGYFDVRDDQDRWIRVSVTKGDLIVLPAGIYHRFTPDVNNFAVAVRLFKDEPVWTPYSRSVTDTDQLPARKQFVESRKSQADHKGAAAAIVTQGPNGTSYCLINAAQAKANYPHLREVNGMLYVSGISSRNPDNSYRGVIKHADGSTTLSIAEQTRGVLDNMKNILSAAGADLSHVVDVTCFLTDMRNYSEFNGVYNQYFDTRTGPTRTTVAVKELPNPLILIEIKAVAVAPARK